MRRRIAWAVGLALLGGVGWVGAATAKGDKAEKDARPRRHVEVIRAFGGSGGYLGVVLEEVAQDDVARLKLADERGALVKSVEDDTPAARAGLKTGDVVLKYQGENVLSASQLRRLIRETPAGRSVALEVARDGGTQRLTADLGRRDARRWAGADVPDVDFEIEMPEAPEAPEPPEAPEAPRPPRLRWHGRGHALVMPEIDLLPGGPRKLGLGYQDIGEQLARYFQLKDDHGVLVTHVEDDGPAGRAGVKAGDVILSFDGRKVRDGDDLRQAVRRAEPGQEVTLSLWRNGGGLDAKVKLAGPSERRGGISL